VVPGGCLTAPPGKPSATPWPRRASQDANSAPCSTASPTRTAHVCWAHTELGSWGTTGPGEEREGQQGRRGTGNISRHIAMQVAHDRHPGLQASSRAACRPGGGAGRTRRGTCACPTRASAGASFSPPGGRIWIGTRLLDFDMATPAAPRPRTAPRCATAHRGSAAHATNPPHTPAPSPNAAPPAREQFHLKSTKNRGVRRRLTPSPLPSRASPPPRHPTQIQGRNGTSAVIGPTPSEHPGDSAPCKGLKGAPRHTGLMTHRIRSSRDRELQHSSLRSVVSLPPHMHGPTIAQPRSHRREDARQWQQLLQLTVGAAY